MIGHVMIGHAMEQHGEALRKIREDLHGISTVKHRIATPRKRTEQQRKSEGKKRPAKDRNRDELLDHDRKGNGKEDDAMTVIKTAGRIMGAKFNKAEQRAMDLEIGRQAAEFERKHELEHDAMLLWVLHTEYGWGLTRLRRFWDTYRAAHRALIRRYETYDSAWEDAWICQRKLKEAGIDIEQWDREFDPRKEDNDD